MGRLQPELDQTMDAVPDRDWQDGRASAQALRAAQARHSSGRRRFVDPATCEREYSVAETEFMLAMEAYKRRSGRMFPTWSEVLEVLHELRLAAALVGIVAATGISFSMSRWLVFRRHATPAAGDLGPLATVGLNPVDDLDPRALPRRRSGPIGRAGFRVCRRSAFDDRGYLAAGRDPLACPEGQGDSREAVKAG